MASKTSTYPLPDSEHEQPPLRAVDGALSDELVEALRVQLPPHLADPRLASLTLLQLLVKLLLDRHMVGQNILHFRKFNTGWSIWLYNEFGNSKLRFAGVRRLYHDRTCYS